MESRDDRDECCRDERQQEVTERQPNKRKSHNTQSKLQKSYRYIETEVDEDSSSTNSTQISNKSKLLSKKEEYAKRMYAAVPLIIEIARQNKKITDIQINTVLASILSGAIVTVNSPGGEKALMGATQVDKDFVRLAMVTCKKTKELGGERPEIRKAAIKILTCRDFHRDLHKYDEYNIVESMIEKISDYIARKTIEMKNKDDNSDNSSDDVSKYRNFVKTNNAKTSGKETDGKKIECKVHKLRANIDSGVLEHAYKGYLKDDIKDNSSLDSKLQGKSFDSLDNSIKNFSSFDTKLRETSLKEWNGNFINYISYNLVEAVNACGANLLSTASDIKREIKKNRLSSGIE